MGIYMLFIILLNEEWRFSKIHCVHGSFACYFPGTNAVRYYFMAWLPKTLPDGIVQHLSTSFEMQNISDLTKAFESNL